jgi:hypothetical protein
MARQRDGKAKGSGGFQARATPPAARRGDPGGSGAGGAKPPQPGGNRRRVAGQSTGAGRTSGGSKAIPDAVARRMARRIAVATGIPSLLGMAVIVASYLLVSRGGAPIPPVATLLGSGACFLLGLLGLSYGVLSASWEEGPGTVLGFEQMPLNVGRIRESVRAMRQGSGAGG